MLSIIPFIHQLFTDTIHEGDIVVDATLGNGHDSLVLVNSSETMEKFSLSIFNKKRLTKQNNDSQKTTVITFIPS